MVRFYRVPALHRRNRSSGLRYAIDQWPALAVTYSVELGVQITFGAPDTSGKTGRAASLGCKACKNLVEHVHTARANKTIIDRLGRPILRWRVALAQTTTDEKGNPTDDLPMINPRS